MTENTLNFVDGDFKTLLWLLTDNPGVAYNIKPSLPQFAAEVSENGVFSWVGSGTNNLFTFNIKRFDTDGMVNLGTHNDRITIKTAGLYQCYASINAQQNGGAGRGDATGGIELYVNNAQINSSIVTTYTIDTITWGFALITTAALRLAVNDFLTFHGQFDRAVTLDSNSPTPLMGCYRVGPSPP